MDWLGDVYLICAVVGGTLLVVQTILMAVGGHHDGDMGHDGVDATHADGGVGHDTGMLKWLSLKAVVASLTFFGLGGLAAQKAGLSPYAGLAISLVCGAAAVVLVGSLMAGMSRLHVAVHLFPGHHRLRREQPGAGTLLRRLRRLHARRGRGRPLQPRRPRRA